MPTFEQADRWLLAETSLGKDKFLVTSIDGTEEMSALFGIRVGLASQDDAIKAKDVLGQPLAVAIQRPDGSRRWIHGIVSQFGKSGEAFPGYRAYAAQIVPKLWLLTKSTDCRIFQEKTALDIIKAILDEYGISKYTVQAAGTGIKRDYCVQYRETTYNFIARLMEEEGIYYYFKHTKDDHELILADATSHVVDCDDAEVEVRPTRVMVNQVHAWRRANQFRTGKWTMRDYNFETPTDTMEAVENTVLDPSAFKDVEVYDFPGGYAKKGDGKKYSKLRMEDEESDYDIVDGESDIPTFSPGAKFKVAKHPEQAEENKSYVLTQVQHSSQSDSAYSGGGGVSYSNSFVCIPADKVFRPVRTARKPVMGGPQTAFVTGPSGEEIYTDKYGRIKVQFHWDREGKKDEKTTCWMRVAQVWAGKKMGAIVIPRIGMEVVVDFLEGDPDRPLVTGCVYNADAMPPYGLPDNKTQSGFKTRSSMGGAESNFNELRFEDKKGSEEIFMQAEKDFNRKVKNNDTLTVGNDRTVTVEKGNEVDHVKTGDRTATIDKGNEKLQVKMGNRDVIVDMGNDTLTVKMGNQTTKIDLGKQDVEAMQSIELKVGQSSVKIDQMGVTIKGMMIKVEGTIQTDVKGLMTNVKGDAMLMVKGGITMIN